MQSDSSNIIWPLIQTILAFLSLGVAIYAILLQRKRKELSYDYSPIRLKTLRILASDEEFERFFPQDAPMDSKLVLIRFINSGNVPIMRDDFVKPLSICLEAPSKLIAVDGPIMNPKELKLSVSVRQNELTLSPTLLNPGNWFMLNVLLKDFTGIINVTGHIVGVSNIIKRRMRWPRSVWSGLGIVAAVYLAGAALRIYFGKWDLPMGIALPLMFIGWSGVYISCRGFNKFLNESKQWDMFQRWKTIKKSKAKKQRK